MNLNNSSLTTVYVIIISRNFRFTFQDRRYECGRPVEKRAVGCLRFTCFKKEDAYGYKLAEITKILYISESALYPVLRRLEDQGLLETYTAEHSGRLRKYYRITAARLKTKQLILELKS